MAGDVVQINQELVKKCKTLNLNCQIQLLRVGIAFVKFCNISYIVAGHPMAYKEWLYHLMGKNAGSLLTRFASSKGLNFNIL